MIIRALDGNGDFTFGAGFQNYLTKQNAIALDIKTRLQCFLGDCFFDAGSGLDWFNLLGSKNEAALLFSVKSVILNTPGVNNVTLLSKSQSGRGLTVIYEVNTVFGLSVRGEISSPVTPFAGVSKFVQDIVISTMETLVDVSEFIQDAQKAVWILYDMEDGFSPVVGAVQIVDAGTVKIVMSPAPSGTFRLVGIS